MSGRMDRMTRPACLRSRRAGMLVGLALFGLGSSALAATPIPTAATAEQSSPDSMCLLAVVGGAQVTVVDARELQSLLAPPPAWDGVTRLAVDTALAHWLEHGSFEDASPWARLTSYRQLIRTLARESPQPERIAENLEQRLGALRRRADLRLGPCYRPLVVEPPDTAGNTSRASGS